MWEFLSGLVKIFPAWFLMALVAFLLAAAAWVLPRLRRDKNGKWYIYSRSYEHQKNRVKAQGKAFAEIKSDIAGLEKRTKSVELENLKQTFYINNGAFPKKDRLIAGLKYVYAGGNGPVREDIGRFVDENPGVYAEIMRDFPQWAFPRDKEAGDVRAVVLRRACPPDGSGERS
jgi:hypothetical protein